MWSLDIAAGSIGAALLAWSLRSLVTRTLWYALAHPQAFYAMLRMARGSLAGRERKLALPASYGTRTPSIGDNSMSILDLSALPAWSQQQIVLPDGNYDPQRFNDCGETCVAAIVSAVHGTPISPASVRANLGGPLRSGLTTGDDLVSMLAYYHVTAVAEMVPTAELQGFLTSYRNQKMPTIVLGRWPTPGNALHWMLTIGVVGQWQYINVWNGQHSWLSWEDTERYYAGQVVVATANLHYDMSHMPIPE